MSIASFQKWRSQYGRMDESLMARMKEQNDENKRLKKICDVKSIQNASLQEALEKVVGPSQCNELAEWTAINLPSFIRSAFRVP